METVLCLNSTKALMRSMVCKSYRVWFNSLIKVTRTRSGVATKAEDAAVYTLPASIWELEQQVATESNFASRLNLKHTISLHSFELDTATYKQQNNTRAFMLPEVGLYPNFKFSYWNSPICANEDAKRNFFAWYDFCGLPTKDKLDIVLDRKNFVNNSVVFVTFLCRWRRSESIPAEIMESVTDNMSSRVDAVMDYLHKNTSNKVKPFISVEYQAQGNSPIMMIGLSNSPEILSLPEHHSRMRREEKCQPSESPAKRDLTKKETFELRQDIQTKNYSVEQLAEKYNCSFKQVGACKAWVKRYRSTLKHTRP